MPSSDADLHNRPLAESASTPPPTEVSPPQSPILPDENTPSLSVRSLFDHPRFPLLRLKKNLPHLPKVQDQYETYHSTIVPLLPQGSLVESALVAICSSADDHAATIDLFNGLLLRQEESGCRTEQRRGVYLDLDDTHGLLVEDMSPSEQSSEVGIELKPKWLLQSPTAPEGARRCRTCALRAQRATSNILNSSTTSASGYCPLDLASGEREGIKRVVDTLIQTRSDFGDGGQRHALAEHLTNFLLNFDALAALRDLQARLDPHGVLALDDEQSVTADFLTATTLRDCTLFLRVNASGVVEGKLGDLDLKTPETGKLQYWKDLEKGLIDGGFYAAADDLITDCRLERR